jgi:death on curing protein
VKYLSPTDVLFIHSAVIDESGGSHGIRDLGLLESAVLQMKQTFGGEELYSSLEEKAAVLLHSLLKNHPFVDGNKRTAVTALGVFMRLNGRTLEASQDELAAWILKLCAHPNEPADLIPWIRKHTSASSKS